MQRGSPSLMITVVIPVALDMMSYSHFPSTLGDDALYLVQPAVGAWRAMFGHVASDFARSAALARFGSPPLHGTAGASASAIKAGSRCLALLRLCVPCTCLSLQSDTCFLRVPSFHHNPVGFSLEGFAEGPALLT